MTDYTRDGLNRMTSINGVGVGHDANQNITSALGKSYGYDAANRLTSAVIGGSSYGFSYDPDGSTASGRRFLHAGQQLIAEYSENGTVLTRHIPGPGLDMPAASLFSSGVRHHVGFQVETC